MSVRNVAVFLAVGSGACSSNSPSGGTVTASTTLSSSLVSESSGRVTSTSRAGGAGLSATGSAGLNEAAHPCPTGTDTCFTPTALSGKFESMVLRIGDGGKYTRLEVLSPTSTPDGGTAPASSTGAVQTFNLGEAMDFSESFTMPSDAEFSKDSTFKELQWTVGIIEAKFASADLGIPTPPATHYTLRFAFADNEELGLTKGDVQVKAEGDTDFKWCPVGTTVIGSCTTTRTGTVITQDAAIVDFTAEAGRSTLPYLTAALYPTAAGTGVVTTDVSSSDFSDKTWSFTVNFDLTKAFAVVNSAPDTARTFTTIFEAMPLLYLRGFAAKPAAVAAAGGVAAILTVSNR